MRPWPTHSIVIDGVAGSGSSNYTLRASGPIEPVDGTLDSYEVTRNENDVVDGETVRGRVAGGRDGFLVYGEITEISLEDPDAAVIRIDGAPVHTVVIDGSGQARADYTLRTAGRTQAVDGVLHGRTVTANASDTIRRGQVDGHVSGGLDGFLVFGEVESIALDEGDSARVFIDGMLEDDASAPSDFISVSDVVASHAGKEPDDSRDIGQRRQAGDVLTEMHGRQGVPPEAVSEPLSGRELERTPLWGAERKRLDLILDAIEGSESAARRRIASQGSDCDDDNRTIHPLQNEICNGLDDNCNGAVDEGVRHPAYRDHDGDGFGSGDPDDRVAACINDIAEDPEIVSNHLDCDDSDPERQTNC